jgi:hypothetical protein
VLAVTRSQFQGLGALDHKLQPEFHGIITARIARKKKNCIAIVPLNLVFIQPKIYYE